MYFKNIDASTFEEMINAIESKLLKEGYINPTFKDAIILREKEYPTGLDFVKFQTALPHTDSEHVNVNMIIPILTKQKIEIFKMGSLTETIKTRIFFLMLVKEKEQHIEKLSNLIQLFQQERMAKLVNDIDNDSSFKKIISIIKKEI